MNFMITWNVQVKYRGSTYAIIHIFPEV